MLEQCASKESTSKSTKEKQWIFSLLISVCRLKWNKLEKHHKSMCNLMLIQIRVRFSFKFSFFHSLLHSLSVSVVSKIKLNPHTVHRSTFYSTCVFFVHLFSLLRNCLFFISARLPSPALDLTHERSLLDMYAARGFVKIKNSLD